MFDFSPFVAFRVTVYWPDLRYLWEAAVSVDTVPSPKSHSNASAFSDELINSISAGATTSFCLTLNTDLGAEQANMLRES